MNGRLARHSRVSHHGHRASPDSLQRGLVLKWQVIERPTSGILQLYSCIADRAQGSSYLFQECHIEEFAPGAL